MAVAEPVVTELTIDARGAERGQAQYAHAMANAQAAQERMIATNTKLFASHNQHERITRQVAAANDNLARSYTAVNDNAKESSASVAGTAKEVLELGGKLKTMATVAYLTWPAFRNGINLQALPALKLLSEGIKEVAPVAHAAGRAAATALAPALAFFMRLAPVVLVVVAAWKLFNHVAETGAALLEKYGNAQRNLIAGVDERLKFLTRFQDDGLSADQVERATQLGARLIEAKRTISEFSKVQFDLTNPALNLQHTWVAIVETIAKAVEWINKLPNWQPVAAAQGWLQDRIRRDGKEAPDWILPPEEAARAVSQADALRAAYERLRGGMGSENNFAVRFSAIKDIPKDANDATKAVQETTKAFDQYDNAVQRVRDQIKELELQSQWYGKNSEEVLKLKTAHDLLRAAKRAGREETPELLAEIDAEATKYAKLRAEVERVAESRRLVESFGSSIVSAFTSGGNAIEKLTSSLAGLGQQLASKNLSNFLNGKSFFGDQKLGSAAGLAGMAGAGAMGYSSGSPLMGALGGAMAGASFGPWGAVAGGALGGIAGLFGQNAQKKEAARKQQEEIMGLVAAANLQTSLVGIDTSTRSGSIRAMEIQNQSALAEAAKKGWQVRHAVESLHRSQLQALNDDWDKREIEIAQQKREEEIRLAEEALHAMRDRVRSLEDRVFAAMNDASTEAGTLAAFDRQANRERLENAGRSAAELAVLEATLAVERFAIQKKFNADTLTEQKRAAEAQRAELNRAAMTITDFLLDMRRGSDSPLSSSARLGAAQQAYGATLGLAQGNNLDALNRITGDAAKVLSAAKDRYGSSAGFQDIFNQIQQQLTALPAIQESTDPVVLALNDIADRQEGVFFDDMANAATAAAASNLQQVALQSRMVSALDQMNLFLQAQAASASANAAAAAAAAANNAAAEAAKQNAALAATKATNKRRYDADIASWQFAAGPHGSKEQKNIAFQKWGNAGPNPANYQPMRHGGLVPGFANGGLIGNGIWNVDSVLARYAHGGHIGLAGGEFVMPAPQTQRNYPQLEAMRSGWAGNDNGVVDELRAMHRTMGSLLSRVVQLEEQGNAKIDRNTDATLGQTESLNRETRIAARKAKAA